MLTFSADFSVTLEQEKLSLKLQETSYFSFVLSAILRNEEFKKGDGC